jgi:hypothetical protein
MYLKSWQFRLLDAADPIFGRLNLDTEERRLGQECFPRVQGREPRRHPAPYIGLPPRAAPLHEVLAGVPLHEHPVHSVVIRIVAVRLIDPYERRAWIYTADGDPRGSRWINADGRSGVLGSARESTSLIPVNRVERPRQARDSGSARSAARPPSRCAGFRRLDGAIARLPPGAGELSRRGRAAGKHPTARASMRN